MATPSAAGSVIESGRGSLLVIGIGNPSRGDDALGLACIEALAAQAPPGVELLTEFQLQVEHVLDLARCSRAVFIDASLNCATGFSFEAVEADMRMAHSHALSPAQLLGAYRRVHGSEPPPASLLAIRGCAFELGAPMSADASANLESALRFLVPWLQSAIRPELESAQRAG